MNQLAILKQNLNFCILDLIWGERSNKNGRKEKKNLEFVKNQTVCDEDKYNGPPFLLFSYIFQVIPEKILFSFSIIWVKKKI